MAEVYLSKRLEDSLNLRLDYEGGGSFLLENTTMFVTLMN